MCREQFPRNSGRTGIEWNTSAHGPCIISIIKKNMESISEANRKVRLKVKLEKTKYMICFTARMQDKVIIYCLLMKLLKIW